MEINNKYVVVGAEVKNAGKSIEVNSISTLFATDKTGAMEEDAYIYLLYKNTYEKPIRAVGKQISGAEDAQAKEAATELRNAVLEQLARDWKTARDKSSPSHSPKLNEWEEPHVRFAPKLSDLIATFATDMTILERDPKLLNPIDWGRILVIVFTGITAAAAILALFIACGKLL